MYFNTVCFKKNLYEVQELLKHFIIQQIHNYIIHRYNYIYYEIFKIAPTCFGSQGIHHQGALYSAWLKLQ